MQNVNIEGIGNKDTVKELFAQVNGLREENCFLVVLNYDYVGSMGGSTGQIATANGAVVGAKAGGVAGGLVGGLVAGAGSNAVNEAVAEFKQSLDEKEKIVFDTTVYGGYLLNIVSDGIGIIPLSNNGKIMPTPKNFTTDIEHYVFFANDEIEAIKLEKLPLRFSTKKLALYLKNRKDICPRWNCPAKDKLVTYQEENFKALSARLG
ncbi:MAG: hypothetical protein IKO10_10750 [Lachnospiraceae bacterium]|nr:hypothetical protein [Lachnospiraceae bacterium]